MIRVECPGCGTRLKGPDDSAGKRIKCPKCGETVRIPEKVYEPEPLITDALPPAFDPYADEESDQPYGLEGGSSGSGYDPPEPAEERRRPCPVCGEMIVATAAKCRFCGEVFDAKLKKAKVKKSKKSKSYSSEDDDLTTGDIVACVICPTIACIGSIVYMIQGKGKGLKAFGLSIAMIVVWNIVIAVFSHPNGARP